MVPRWCQTSTSVTSCVREEVITRNAYIRASIERIELKCFLIGKEKLKNGKLYLAEFCSQLLGFTLQHINKMDSF